MIDGLFGDDVEVVDEEPEALPKEMLAGLRIFCEHLQKNDIYAATIGVPTSDEETMEYHSLAVIYHGPVDVSVPERERH